jgi:hypothetical protein
MSNHKGHSYETHQFDLILTNHHGIRYCHQIISNSLSNQKDKSDYAELNDIKYGLLNVDEWKQQLSAILTDEINKLPNRKSI